MWIVSSFTSFTHYFYELAVQLVTRMCRCPLPSSPSGISWYLSAKWRQCTATRRGLHKRVITGKLILTLELTLNLCIDCLVRLAGKASSRSDIWLPGLLDNSWSVVDMPAHRMPSRRLVISWTGELVEVVASHGCQSTRHETS